MGIRYEAFPIGIEEEYLLIDPETRSLAGRQPEGFMARCKEILGPRVTHEFLQSQVEIDCLRLSPVSAVATPGDLWIAVECAMEERLLRVNNRSSLPAPNFRSWTVSRPLALLRKVPNQTSTPAPVAFRVLHEAPTNASVAATPALKLGRGGTRICLPGSVLAGRAHSIGSHAMSLAMSLDAGFCQRLL